MKLCVSLNHKKLNELQYTVVVEMWDHVKHGRNRRDYLRVFTYNERQKAIYWYKIFYNWHLVKGTPDEHVFKSESLIFVKKLIHFFSTL